MALLLLAPGTKGTPQAAGNITERSHGRQRRFTEYIEANFQSAGVATTIGEPLPGSSTRR
ncbi:MAG: hypothetical protein WA869_22130 [Alloacidobacterium sp.]